MPPNQDICRGSVGNSKRSGFEGSKKNYMRPNSWAYGPWGWDENWTRPDTRKSSRGQTQRKRENEKSPLSDNIDHRPFPGRGPTNSHDHDSAIFNRLHFCYLLPFCWIRYLTLMVLTTVSVVACSLCVSFGGWWVCPSEFCFLDEWFYSREHTGCNEVQDNFFFCFYWILMSIQDQSNSFNNIHTGGCSWPLLKHCLASLEQCLSVAKQCLSNDREHPPE